MKQEFLIAAMSKTLILILALFLSSIYIDQLLIMGILVTGFSIISIKAIYEFIKFKLVEQAILKKNSQEHLNKELQKATKLTFGIFILPVLFLHYELLMETSSIFLILGVTIILSFIYYIGLIAQYRSKLFTKQFFLAN